VGVVDTLSTARVHKLGSWPITDILVKH